MAAATQDALLLVSTGDKANSTSIVLRDAGYQVAIATSELRAVALLFLMRSFAGVVIDGCDHETASLDLASRLHGIRAEVPIIVVCRQPVDLTPVSVDACVAERELIETLAILLKSPLHRVATGPRKALRRAS